MKVAAKSDFPPRDSILSARTTINMEKKPTIKAKRHKKRKSRTQGISDETGTVASIADLSSVLRERRRAYQGRGKVENKGYI